MEKKDGVELQSLRVGILECGAPRQPLASRHGTYADWFERLLRENSETAIQFSRYAVCNGNFPASDIECDCWIITGSSASVLEKQPWMTQLQGFLERASGTQKIIGVCFGHQIVAETFGGKVERSPHGWGVGLHDYEISTSEHWMTPPAKKISLIASHQDWVSQAPEQARVIGGNAFCPIGMMQIGENILTLQLHPEMRPDFSTELYNSRLELLGKSKVNAAVQSLQKPIDDMQVGAWFRRFAQG